MIVGERGIVIVPANPDALLARSPHNGFFASLNDDILADVFAAYSRECDRTNRTDCILLDLVRAEYARRHRPAAWLPIVDATLEPCCA